MKGTKSKRRKIKPNEPLFPGDRIVIFVKQFEKEIKGRKYFYYAAADECTHLRVGKIYGRHSTLSALDFIQYIITSFPFPIHYVHTPLDNVFTSVAQSRVKTHAFTQNVRRLGIKHHVPTRKQFESDLYYQRMKRFDSNEGFLKLAFNSVLDTERTVHNFLMDYNNKQPRIELQKITPLQKLQEYEQFRELKAFDPLQQQ